ncbi:MAG TPA: hypothetical protein ENN99_16830 [Chloroflexi bacterium]|nr:hypothetical protein [Chloroflexota bacterium]
MASFKKRSRCGKSTFRSKIEAKVIDELLYRFVSLVKKGLELMLTEPSKLAAAEFRKHPEYSYTAGDIPALTLWVAEQVYEIPRSEFCQHVLANPEWSELLGVSSQADLDRWFDWIAEWKSIPFRAIELAVHDGLKEGDQRDLRPATQKPAVQDEFAEFIGVSRVMKLLRKKLRPFLKRLDALDPPHPPHRPRVYRTRSFLLAEVLRWILGFQSTEELRRKLEQHVHLAGAVNFKPGEIPSKSTFSHRRIIIPLDDLKAILHALVEVLVRCKVIDGRAWVIDLSRVPTYSSVSKTYPESPNGKSDPQAAFCGYPDNDGGFQFGYCMLWIVDYKSELPFAVVFGAGSAQDSPLAKPLLKQACAEHPVLARRCQYISGDSGYDAIHIFEFILERLRALPAITKNPRNAADPTNTATDAYCVLRRPGPWHQIVHNCHTAVDHSHSWAKLTFNLKYHKHRGWDAVERCVLFAAIAMLGVAWVAVKTGHPEKIRSARTWISFN